MSAKLRRSSSSELKVKMSLLIDDRLAIGIDDHDHHYEVMKRLKQTADLDIWFGRIERPYELVSPFEGNHFSLLLVIADSSITIDERSAVSDQIVQQGCRYAVCWGHDCSLWDDSIDYSSMSRFPDFVTPDEHFIMTTWHEDDSLSDVIEYLRWNTMFDDYITQRALIVILGGDANLESEVRTELQSQYG